MSARPSYEAQQVRQHMAHRQAAECIFKYEIKPRISEQIVKDHQRRPIGRRSVNHGHVLVVLGNHHMMMPGKYIRICTKPYEKLRIAQLQEEPGSLCRSMYQFTGAFRYRKRQRQSRNHLCTRTNGSRIWSTSSITYRGSQSYSQPTAITTFRNSFKMCLTVSCLTDPRLPESILRNKNNSTINLEVNVFLDDA